MSALKDLRDFDSLIELMDYFKNESTCEEYLAVIRWNGEPTCPYCDSKKVNALQGKTKRFKCYGCRKQFGIKVGTIFHKSPITLRKWFLAMYLVTAADKKGISSYALARNLKVSQTTAWFVLQRIRESYSPDAEIFTNAVEADETFVGGSEINKHSDKRTPNNQGRSTKTKTAVLGIAERDGKVYAIPVHNCKGETILPIVREKVAAGTTIYTDEYRPYRRLSTEYVHNFVCHKAEQYVVGEAHTNNLECFWSHMKRTIIGTYHQVSRKHLSRYVNESTFRFNNRKLSMGSIFDVALANGINKRITYKTLVYGK